MESLAPTVSVIIPHHVGRKFIHRCLASLAISEGVTFEVLVVTSDGTYYIPEPMEHWARHIYVEGGPAHKRNEGVRQTTGETIVFLDDDTEVSPYFLYECVRGLQALPKAGMLFTRIYNGERREELDDCGSWLTWTGFLYARASNRTLSAVELNQPTRCLASKSAGCAIRRGAFYRAGGFDASYFILGEETDLAWRVWLSGQEVWYWPSAVCWHWFNTGAKPVQDFYTLQRIHTYGCRNYLRLLTSNLGTLRLVRTLPWHLLAWLVAALGFLARGQPRRAGAIGQGVAQYLSTLPATLRKRAQVQRQRVVSDAQLWPLVTTHIPWTYYPQRMIQYIWNGLHG